MSLLKMLFGAPDAAVKTVTTVASGLDKLNFSEQEKSEHRGKMLEWVTKYMESTQGQNLARRLIALIVTVQWALLINIGLFCGLMAKTVAKDAQPDTWAQRSEFVFKVLNECVNESFGIVMLFYFGAGMVNRYLNSRGEPAKK